MNYTSRTTLLQKIVAGEVSELSELINFFPPVIVRKPMVTYGFLMILGRVEVC